MVDLKRVRKICGERALNLLRRYNISISNVKVQGSSLRTPNASDIDLAVFLSEQEFNTTAQQIRAGFRRRNAPSKVISDFENQVLQGKINSFYFDRLVGSSETFNQELYELRSFISESRGIDLSIMKEQGQFNIGPFLNF